MGISSNTAITSILGGVGLGYMMSQQPKAANISAPPQPQAAKNPSASTLLDQMKGMGQSGGSPGVAQTLLTGTQGIDPSLLQLGRNTLLGGSSSVGGG